MAISGPRMFSRVVTITTGLCCGNRRCLIKWHYLGLPGSAYIVILTTGLNYSKRSPLKKWNFMNLVRSVSVVTITTELNHCKKSCLKKWRFLSIIVITMREEEKKSCQNSVPQKVILSRPSMFRMCSKHYS